MKYCILITILWLLAACATEKRAIKRILKLHAEHPFATATVCGRLYPPLEYVRDSIVYRPGAAAELVYVYADCDTITDKQAGKLKIPCPPVHITDTVLLYKEKQVVNRAENERLLVTITECKETNAVLTRERTILLWVVIAFVAYLLIRWIRNAWRIYYP